MGQYNNGADLHSTTNNDSKRATEKSPTVWGPTGCCRWKFSAYECMDGSASACNLIK